MWRVQIEVAIGHEITAGPFKLRSEARQFARNMSGYNNVRVVPVGRRRRRKPKPKTKGGQLQLIA